MAIRTKSCENTLLFVLTPQTPYRSLFQILRLKRYEFKVKYIVV